MKSKKPREGDYWHFLHGTVRVYGDRVGFFTQYLKSNGHWSSPCSLTKKFWKELESLKKTGNT